MKTRMSVVAGLLAVSLGLPLAAYCGGPEGAWTEAGTFDARLNQGFDFLRGRAKAMPKPGLPPRMRLPKDAFGGLGECSVVGTKFIQQPRLQDAVKMLSGCMEAVSRKYGATVAAASGLLSRPGYRGGVPGIKILVSGELRPGSPVLEDLYYTVEDINHGTVLTYPAAVEYLGIIRPLGGAQQPARASSLQPVVDGCGQAALTGPIETSKDFVAAYGGCLKNAGEFAITAVMPSPPLDESVFGLNVWVFSRADQGAIEAMNGSVAVGRASVLIKAYRDAKIEPFGPPAR